MALEIFKAWIPFILFLAIWYLSAWYFGKKVEAAKAKKCESIDIPPE